ncbi:SMR family transporter [Rheinheimera baltica]|uniref:Guanidinium exporter n=1 Tax=Rheinheimera baltica TaxID=67576 RepID=A0ABT9I4H6_9GAMM|nr:SMR family transporter [Rheinheimera baltica]MDP5138284.1 SMR family transporter [Rheinheimera baltica]MDP5150435.1 SMR family transporter [Rheinheimera baltica]
MYWFILIIAGVLEAGWLIGIEKSASFSKIPYVLFAVACMTASLLLFGLSLKQIPAATAYLVWLAVGVLSITLINHYFFGQLITGRQLFCFALIICGVAGLKLSS